MATPALKPSLQAVALRKESVDRNFGGACGKLWVLVALRKESVDRNRRLIVPYIPVLGSLSARRAWIEILAYPDMIICTKSLSARRAWIEITSLISVTANVGRSPQGERG